MKQTLITLLILLLALLADAQDTVRFAKLEAHGRKISFELCNPEYADVYFVSVSSRWTDDYHCLVGWQEALVSDTIVIPAHIPLADANYLVVIQTRPSFNVHYGTVAIRREEQP